MNNAGASSPFLPPGLLPSPKLRKSHSPVHTPRLVSSRNHSFDGADKTIKKSLVEEFYKKEAKSKQRSYTDIPNSLASPLSTAQPSGAQPEEDGAETEGLSSAPHNEFGQRQLSHVSHSWNDRHFGFSENTAETLINVDRGGSKLTLEEVDAALQEAVEASGRSQGVHVEPGTGQRELQLVQQYLQQETAKVDEIYSQLRCSVGQAKDEYRTRLEASMDKVQVLRRELGVLGDRVAAAKERIYRCRDVMSGPMEERLAVLDSVCRNFEEYDRLLRRQRIKYLVSAAVVAALAAVTYTAVR